MGEILGGKGFCLEGEICCCLAYGINTSGDIERFVEFIGGKKRWEKLAPNLFDFLARIDNTYRGFYYKFQEQNAGKTIIPGFVNKSQE